MLVNSSFDQEDISLISTESFSSKNIINLVLFLNSQPVWAGHHSYGQYRALCTHTGGSNVWIELTSVPVL